MHPLVPAIFQGDVSKIGEKSYPLRVMAETAVLIVMWLHNVIKWPSLIG